MASISRHYTLHVVFVLTAQAIVLASAVVCFCLHTNLLLAVGIILCLLWLLLNIRLWRLVRFPIGMTQSLLGAMESRDTTMRFPTTSDPLLSDVTADMNRVLASYCNDRYEMETLRSYYDRILRVMTHELRNTVAPILSLTDWMMKEGATPDEREKAIQTIHNQAESIHGFLNSYHQLTHLPEPVRTTIPVRTLIDSMKILMAGEPLADRITYSIHEDFTVNADEGLLKLAMLNIIRNALQAIDNKDDGKISVLVARSATEARIIISNNGPVIPASLTEQIFQPFWTTKTGGSGIGLALSRQIMLLHGGNLTCESNPPLTHFIFSLP